MALRDWTLAQFYEGKSQYGAARYYYTQMIRDYPTTKLAEEARNRMVAIADEPDTPPNYFQWLEDLLPSNKNETIISAQPREATTR
jgi:outer membrane protein assembly factor BamD (BamD/ComL family)